jgi:hypothetical protein
MRFNIVRSQQQQQRVQRREWHRCGNDGDSAGRNERNYVDGNWPCRRLGRGQAVLID